MPPFPQADSQIAILQIFFVSIHLLFNGFSVSHSLTATQRVWFICRCKTSILFSLPGDDEPGALLHALDHFTKEDINLVWLDSRELSPGESQGNDWKYLFYANFEGSVLEPRVERALDGLKKQAKFFRVMGSHRMQARFLEEFP